MYHAKGAGRDTDARVRTPHGRGRDLAPAHRKRTPQRLRDHQFELYLQPVLTIRDGHILGAEVLLRWQHPTQGLISPTEFLPYIENCALMLKLDDWVLLESCRLLAGSKATARWRHRLPGGEHQSPAVPSTGIRTTCAADPSDTGADPKRLQFEITPRPS